MEVTTVFILEQSIYLHFPGTNSIAVEAAIVGIKIIELKEYYKILDR
jgi:hypothetical protein